MRFRKYAFSLSSKMHRSIRVHTTVLMRFRLSALYRSETVELRVVTHDELYAHATKTRLRCFRSSFSFSTAHTNTICMRFHFDPLSRAFLNRSFFMKTLSVLV